MGARARTARPGGGGRIVMGGRPGFTRDPNNAGCDWAGGWKSWCAKDFIKPVNMAGCRPPAHAYDARSDQPMNTVKLGGPNAPCVRSYHFETFDTREGPSDRTKAAAETFANAASGVKHDPLAAYHPPKDTKLPVRRPEMEPDRWVPMNHNSVTELYNPLSHQRVVISKTKPPGRPRAEQDVDLVIKKGDPNKGAKEIAKAVGLQPQGPGNYESTAQVVMYNPTAFRRRKGVTEFIDITHPFKPNFSDNFHERITKDPRVFARVQGSMVAWMEAAIIGKSKIPFRKTQPPGV